MLSFLMQILVTTLLISQTALDFDPTAGTQQVEIPDITCPLEFTFEAWIYYRGSDSFYETILEFGNDAPFFGLEQGHLTIYPYIESPETIQTNQWIHVAGSYSSFTEEAQMYIDGGLVAMVEDVPINIIGEGAGIGYNGTDGVFNGSIDEVRIWNFVRDQEDILEEMNICLTGNEPGLYAYYNFDEGSGMEVNDATGNNFNGVLVNMDPVNDWIMYDNCMPSAVDKLSDYTTNFQLFPNPTSGFIQINGAKEQVNYKLFNVFGSELQSGIIVDADKLDVQHLQPGIYYLQLDGRQTLSFVKN